MGDYSYGQLEQLWIQAGGARALAPLMAAIALAESGGNPSANNYTDNSGRQTSWGLWQVSNGTHQWPGPQDPNNPLNNAKYAVAKYKSQGLGAWGTYDSGAYKQYYQGGTPPSALPQGGTGSGSQGQPVQADFTSFWSGNDVMIWPYQALNQAVTDVWHGITGFKAGTDALTQIARGFTMLTGLFDRLIHAVEWFFVPSHWVRIICFGFGLMAAIPGLYALMRAGQGSGDISLALGILLVTIAGILWFIAFHNLPADVSNLQELLGWISNGIRTGHAASGPAPGPSVTPDTGLGAQVGQVAGSAVGVTPDTGLGAQVGRIAGSAV